MEMKIRSLIKEAMLEKNKEKQITYKNILETAQKTAKKVNAAVTDEMITNAIKTEIKQLRDVIGYFEEESEKYAEVIRKLSYCEAVLPRMATDEEIRCYLMDNDIEKNVGVCMRALKEHFGSNMDSKAASVVAREYANS